jgi:2-polyprenyl-3-methyl-5-hydroxy-6-metoxy-1,4-benzoquinol methylase
MKCPICSGVTRKMAIKFDSLPEFLEKSDLYDCYSCDLKFIYPIPEKEIKEYYQEQYRLQHDNQFTPTEDYINGRLYVAKKRFGFLKDIIRKYFDEKPSILDIGCSEGSFVQVARDHGCLIHGIDPNKGYVDYANNKYNRGLDNVDLLDYQTNMKYDVITLWHVFEHFTDLYKALDKIKSLLKDNGLLIIQVPNTERRNLSEENVEPEHYYHFTNHNLGIILGKKGFEELKRQTDFLGSHIVNHSIANNVSKFSILKKIIRPVYRLVTPIYNLIFRDMEKGTNATMVVRKR